MTIFNLYHPCRVVSVCVCVSVRGSGARRGMHAAGLPAVQITGEQILQNFNMSPNGVPMDLIALSCFIVVSSAVTLFALKFENRRIR